MAATRSGPAASTVSRRAAPASGSFEVLEPLEQKETVTEIRQALFSLDNSIDRLVICLRHGVLGAAATIDHVVIEDGPLADFTTWAVGELGMEKRVATKIAGRLRRQRLKIRTRLQEARTIAFLLSNEEIADLLDSSAPTISRLAAAAMQNLRKALAA
jgi:hypothetical protein